VKHRITPEEQQAVLELGLPGVGFSLAEHRVYPKGQLAGHVTGFVNIDGRGLAGIERSLDSRLSQGNQPLALSLDFLAIALAELGSISERRTYQLISGSRDLPNYLVANPGINSGLMIPQYTAASLVSQNKQWCTPASVDSIVSSNGQEDHVSMGANAATKAFRVVNNVYAILAIELISASQALHFRRPLKTSLRLDDFVNTFRHIVPFIDTDRVLHDDMVKAERFLKEVEVF
jgi:histidine ammonia-lyase